MASATTATTTSTDSSVYAYTTTTATIKRGKLTQHHQQPPLLPGLPDHIAQLCLSSVPPSLLFSVCRSWRRLIYSPSFPPFLSLYALFSQSNDDIQTSTHTHDDFSANTNNSIQLFSFDPISSKWHILPDPPSPAADPPLQLIHCHPSFLSRYFPIQSVAVSGCLVLVAATTHHFLPALSCPLVFNPISMTWACGPPLSTPRRWCAAGSFGGAVYVASGIGSHYSVDVARSLEKWDLQQQYHNNKLEMNNKKWEKMKNLEDGKFARDAIEAVGYRGKLYMVNVKGDAAKQGIAYDVVKDAWEGMPEGMLGGWKGPVASTSIDEDEVNDAMYVVDEAKGALKRYDPDKDGWYEMLQSDRLKGAAQMAAARGKVCVVCGGGGAGGIMVVDVVAEPPRIWLLDTPSGFNPVAVHILPRMNLLIRNL